MLTCSRCQQPLRAGAKFCAGCGHPAISVVDFSIACPHCRLPARAGAKFCAGCGHSLVLQPAITVKRPLPSVWMLIAITVVVMILFVGLGAIWYSGQPVNTATPVPNTAATVTHAAATPTLVPALETAVPISD